MNYQNVTPKSVKIYQLINRKDMKVQRIITILFAINIASA